MSPPLADEVTRAGRECPQDPRPPPSRELYSLFAEAPEPAQHAEGDAVQVVPQESLQHGGQGELLHPHLGPRQRDRVSSGASSRPSRLCGHVSKIPLPWWY